MLKKCLYALFLLTTLFLTAKEPQINLTHPSTSLPPKPAVKPLCLLCQQLFLPNDGHCMCSLELRLCYTTLRYRCASNICLSPLVWCCAIYLSAPLCPAHCRLIVRNWESKFQNTNRMNFGIKFQFTFQELSFNVMNAQFLR